jgi:hypothetical protein
MKTTLTSLLLFCLSFQFLPAQITVDQDDFASADDTARMSQAIWNPLLDFGATDTNYTWDFSDLVWQSQYVDEFLNTYSINPIYGFTFSNTSINPYRCNIAKQSDNPLTTLPILSAIFTEGYNFYYKTPSMYRQRGIGMKVSAFPTAIPMSHADTLYHFPMNYGNEDSCWSDYKVHVPQLGTYVHQQHRQNKVDGWGTLISPFGTFDALRMRTEILSSDSLYIDTLSSGFKVDNDILREYKWFGKNQMEPLLQINTQAGVFGQFQGFEFVTKIVYRDSVRFLPTGILNVQANEIELKVFPNPSTGLFFVSVPIDLSDAKITVTDISGRLMLSRQMVTSLEEINAETWAKGVYILTVQNNKGIVTKKIAVQ